MTASCYQCGLPIPPAIDVSATINNQPREFCCTACLAVAELIEGAGLDNFYRYRKDFVAPETSQAADAANSVDYTAWDNPEINHEFVTSSDDGCQQANLYIEGIHCAACAWLIEEYLSRDEAVETVSVNSATHRCLLKWKDNTRLSSLLKKFTEIGYQPKPAIATETVKAAQHENRLALMRLGVAGFAMVQVGMFAVALYAGALQGMDAEWQWLLRAVSAAVATPVVLFSARPFFKGAFHALKTRHLTMDVPVALAIGLAYVASCWATITNSGEVYFDSVSMFTFFLLSGRYLEMRVRHRNESAVNQLSSMLPHYAQRIKRNSEQSEGAGSATETVMLHQIAVNDYILVKEGGTIPVDGEVIDGASHVDESMLTGEAQAVTRSIGDNVAAGTINLSGGLVIKVTAVGRATRLSAIKHLMDEALHQKPSQVSQADRLAGYFVAAVLVVASAVALVWYFVHPADALWVTLSVLVVTCPCALSLATPVSLTAAIHRLRQLGLLVTKPHVLENLAYIDYVIFDKTGTLTAANITLHAIEINQSRHFTNDSAVEIASALEKHSSHPLAAVFKKLGTTRSADNIQTVLGAGVQGSIDGQEYRLGSWLFAKEAAASGGTSSSLDLLEDDSRSQGIWLFDQHGWIAHFLVSDSVRAEAASVVSALLSHGTGVELLSGDHQTPVKVVADAVGIDNYRSSVSPEDKLKRVSQLQRLGHRVLMVGDGLNDLPVLSGADVSMAMSSATDLAQIQADSVLLNNDLRVVEHALGIGEYCRRIIRQNLSWAVAYNILALPLAAAGLVPPYLAAIGMSLSSLLVILNATRLYGFAKKPR
ncbi:heavy metal translocating P-type ATPase [Aurantivibrio plasticivorans]